MEQKFKPFDWTFTSTYQGTLNEKFRSEPTEQTLNKMKLMQRENILFYHDLTLYEDELHDHGISVMSVRIVSRLAESSNRYLIVFISLHAACHALRFLCAAASFSAHR